MLVCDCDDIYYESILKEVAKHGNDLEAIQEATEAGLACRCCLEDDCDKVEISLPLAIQKALLELE